MLSEPKTTQTQKLVLTQELLDDILIDVLGQAMSMRAHGQMSESEISDYDTIEFPVPRKRSRLSHTCNKISLLKIQGSPLKRS